MELSPYAASLRDDLIAALGAVLPESADRLDRIGPALDPAIRLALLDILSEAAAEITQQLPNGSVDVRLNGRSPELVVDVDFEPAVAPTTAPPVEEDESEITRITLRIPESVKARAEELAAKAGLSLNSWVVNALRNATRDDGSLQVDLDLSSFPLFDAHRRGSRSGQGRRMNGWI